MARPVILDLVNDYKLFQGKAFSQAPVPSARCCMGCFPTGELWPSPVVPRVFSAVCSFFMWIASQYGVLLPSATPVLQGKRKFPFLAQCVTEVEAFAVQQTNEAGLAKGGQSLEHLFSCPPLHQD